MYQASRGRVRRAGAAQWQRWLDEQAQSGLTQHAFCEQRGLAYSTFTRWKQRLSSTELAPAPMFTEVMAPSPQQIDNGFDFELDLGRIVRLRWRRR